MKVRSLVQNAALALLGLMCAGAVQASCSMDTPSIVLAPYNALEPKPNPTPVSFSLRCTQNTMAKIQASAGNSGNLYTRQLRQGTDAIAYNLYVGSTATAVWGNGTSGSSVVSASVPANTTVQVVGNVRLGPANPPPGVYTDVLMFTVIY